MIIVEGPDGAGKTTLVGEIMATFPDLIEGERGTDDRNKLWEVTRDDTYRALRIALAPGAQPCIWDRLFWSEFVYHTIASRECQFNLWDEMTIPRVIQALKVPVIWCLPQRETVGTNVAKSKQMEGVDENVMSIYIKYQMMLSNQVLLPPGINLMHYAYDQENSEAHRSDIFKRVERYLLESRSMA